MESADSWIEANFKETDLTHMRAGQPVTVSVDAYPGHALTGTVASIGAGTGAEFSLLPAQNATGNWVKVVQRVPVRIRLDQTDAACCRSAPGSAPRSRSIPGTGGRLSRALSRRRRRGSPQPRWRVSERHDAAEAAGRRQSRR